MSISKFIPIYAQFLMMIISMTFVMTQMIRRSNNLRVMINHPSAMMSSLMCFLTVGVDSLLALLNIDGVYNFLASLLGDLASVFLWVLVALLLFLVMTLGSTGVNFFSRL